ncbi:hypothetical protein Ahy_B06g084292 [Arachis hypogaea]|uniref:Clp1 P-loop domain-containing protein n=1 Tax=Arachis hypogaea TaxID=3818 RepID=A0A444YRI6_ARAHY|nr:hypothetical protein Ahy_B06g084292 [Arachis hypogaea]
MEGTTEIDYTTNRTPVVSYVNVHAILETRRTRAKASSPGDSESSQGPRVIVVGPTNSGKSTLSRMLLSWVAKQGSKPTFLLIHMKDMRIQLQFTLFGFDSNNVEFYKVLVKKLGGMLERQFTGNTKSRASGMVMNTMGRIEGVGYDLLLHATRTLKANVVLVLGQLYTIANFSLAKNNQKYKPTTHELRICFKRETQLRMVDDFNFPSNAFHFVPNELILTHVVGLLTAKKDIIEFTKNGKKIKLNKSKIRCTL